MSCDIKSIGVFEKQSKRLIKKFPSLKSELLNTINLLKENPQMGISIGNACFKIRISIASKGKGKSGGARLITHFYVKNNTVYLLSIYDKSDMENISDKIIFQLLNQIPD